MSDKTFLNAQATNVKVESILLAKEIAKKIKIILLLGENNGNILSDKKEIELLISHLSLLSNQKIATPIVTLTKILHGFLVACLHENFKTISPEETERYPIGDEEKEHLHDLLLFYDSFDTYELSEDLISKDLELKITYFSQFFSQARKRTEIIINSLSSTCSNSLEENLIDSATHDDKDTEIEKATPTPADLDTQEMTSHKQELSPEEQKSQDRFSLSSHKKKKEETPSDDFLNDLGIGLDSPWETINSEKRDSTTDEYLNNLSVADEELPKTQHEPFVLSENNLNALVDIVGEFVLDRTRLSKIEDEIKTKAVPYTLAQQINESFLLLNRHMLNLQDLVLKMRMAPLKNFFSLFNNALNELAQMHEKSVELEITGEEIEVDKVIGEKLYDLIVPLLHNCIEHSIESPIDRINRNKNKTGYIKIAATLQGQTLTITIKDDGYGIDIEKIRQKALHLGLIKEEEVLTDQEYSHLIFTPYFSTTTKGTPLDGMGMQVVMQSLRSLKGYLEVASEQGKGSTISLRIPRTLALTPCLFFQVEGETYGVPVTQIIETHRAERREIQSIGKTDLINIKGEIIPALSLKKIFEFEKNTPWYRKKGEASSHPDKLMILIVGVAEKKVGIVAESLLGQQDVVIKSLGTLIEKPKGIAGGYILGDGVVSLILDINELISLKEETK